MFNNKNILITGATGSFGKQYIRTILKRELNCSIQKWESPKIFGEFTWMSKKGTKSFSPDIIIDLINGKARAIFDVKNKNYDLESYNISDITSVADIYQILL